MFQKYVQLLFSSQKFQFRIKKKIVKALPNKNQLCVPINYINCLMNHFKDETLMKYQCILPFSGLVPLQKNPTLKYCSTEVTKSYIKKIKIILKQNEFKHCLDQVSCNQTIFTLVNPEDRISYR